MKLMLITSRSFYSRIPQIKNELEARAHEIKLPNCYGKVFDENYLKSMTKEEYIQMKGPLLRKNRENITSQDGVLVLNFEKEGSENYVGGATFLEIYTAWDLEKKIFFYNPLPKGVFYDELVGMNPTIIYGDLNLVK